MTVEACLILSRQQLEAGHFDDAIKQLENLLAALSRPSGSRPVSGQLSSRAKLLPAEAICPLQETFFVSLSKTFDYDRQNTLFNWAICSLQLGDAAGFEQAFRELEKSQPHSDLVGELLICQRFAAGKVRKCLG